MYCLYAVISAALVPLLNNFFPILRESYSIWLVPVLFIGFFVALVLLHMAVFFTSIGLVSLKREVKAYKYFRFISNITLPMLFKILRVKIDVETTAELPQDKRVVLVCNHTHIFDPVILLLAFPDLELTFFAKQEIIKEMPIVAKFIHSLKGIFIDRENLRGGAKAIIEGIKLIKSDTASLGVFPEGHRTADGRLQEFKGGAFKAATKTGAPVVVCTVKGVTDIMKNFPLKKSKVNVSVLSVLSSEDKTAEQLSETSRELMLSDLKK